MNDQEAFNPKEIIEQEGLSLNVDESLSLVCPFCQEDWENQGRPGAIWKPSKSMSITRIPQGLLYNCFRATCRDGHGFIPNVISDPSKYQKRKAFTPAEYNYPTTDVPKRYQKFLAENYLLSYEDLEEQGIKYSPNKDSLVIPIQDLYGHEVGYNDRDYFNARKPKAIAYWFNDVIKLHFPIGWDKSKSDELVVVEDQLSSIRVKDHCRCAALLSCNVNPMKMAFLSSLTSKIILALDPGVETVALNIATLYRMYFDKLDVRFLSKDPKEMSDEEIKNEICTSPN